MNYEECIRSNLKGSFEVVTFATKNKIQIIYSATSSMLGNDGKDENLSPYSWSKSKNIELIKNFNKWFGLKYEIVFFYNVYGPGQIKNSKMSAVIGIFESQYKKKKPLTVVKPGTQKEILRISMILFLVVIWLGKKDGNLNICWVQKNNIQ